MHKLIQNQYSKIKEVCQRKHVKSMWVFGSINSDRFTEESDIDFLVNFDILDFGEYADSYFELCDELELILGRKVDVVTEKSLSNPYFIKKIEASRELIYERLGA